MRASEEKVKAAILHPERKIRRTAVAYFSGSFSSDPTVMPLVIRAVEKYGWDASFSVLRSADDLAQTPETVAWLVNELSKDWNLEDVGEDNHCVAVALILSHAAPEFLKPEYADLRSFPEELRTRFQDRLDMAQWGWDAIWKVLEDLGQQIRARGDIRLSDLRRGGLIAEALARHHDRAPEVLELLQRRYQARDPALMRFLEPFITELAGRMRIEQAAAVLVERLGGGDIILGSAIESAMTRIGGDHTVQTIADRWGDWEGSPSFRNSAADVLEHIHTDLSVQTCLEFLRTERDPTTRSFLANALLGHFADEAVEPIRQMLVGPADRLDAEELGLRRRLVAASTVMGVTFPEFDLWYQQAVQTDWGDLGDRRFRIRKSFRDDVDLEDALAEVLGLRPTAAPPPRPAMGGLFKKFEPIESIPGPMKPVGRNDPCPCGSGKKYKKCCLKK